MTSTAGRIGSHDASRPAPSWLLSFLLLAGIWGCSFWWIKLGLTVLAPVQVAFARLAIGAATLLLVARLGGLGLPRDRTTWRHLLVVSLLINSIPFTLFAFGETHVSSVVAGIINATTPLATLVVVLVAFPEEHPTRERIAGLLVGFIGVLVVIGVWEGIGTGEWLGILACVLAISCYGVAFPYTRRHLTGLELSPVSLAAGQVLCGAAVLAPIAILAGPVRAMPGLDAILGMLALGSLGSGIAFVLNYRIIAAAGGTTASTVTYLTPLVAVVVGVAFLGESLSWHQPVGALTVLVGVAISQGRLRAALAPRRATERFSGSAD